MESNKPHSDSKWAGIVNTYENPAPFTYFSELDEIYMTPTERIQMYKDAADELKAKIKVLKEQKKKNKK